MDKPQALFEARTSTYPPAMSSGVWSTSACGALATTSLLRYLTTTTSPQPLAFPLATTTSFG